jgi:hypothetical protein
VDILKKVEGLTFVYFDESDVVRHHLVQRIIRAYDEHKSRAEDQMSPPSRSNGKSQPASDLPAVPETTGPKPAVSPARTQADE